MSSETTPDEVPYKTIIVVLRSGRELRAPIDMTKAAKDFDMDEAIGDYVEALSSRRDAGGHVHLETEAGLTIVPLREIESVTFSYS